MEDFKNIMLSIFGFLAMSSFAYWALGIFDLSNIIRSILAIVIALIVGVIILKRKK
jgi:hypothetical protein